jgi:hypothetical protein
VPKFKPPQSARETGHLFLQTNSIFPLSSLRLASRISKCSERARPLFGGVFSRIPDRHRYLQLETWSRLIKRADRRFSYMVINTTKITAPIIQIIKKSIDSGPQTIPPIFKPHFPTSFYQLFFFPLFRVSSMDLSGISITSPICHLIHFLCFGFSLRNMNIYCSGFS